MVIHSLFLMELVAVAGGSTDAAVAMLARRPTGALSPVQL